MEESDKKDTGAPDIYFLTKSFNHSKEETLTSNETLDGYKFKNYSSISKTKGETMKSYAALDWYVIKNNESISKTKVISHHLSRPPHDCNLSTHVVIGSTIYIVGGYVCDGTGQYNKTRAVYYIDIRHPQNGWKEVAPMNNERIRPSAFGVEGKLYVIGGCNYNRHSYVEVYDPISNKWENFPRLKDGRDLPHCVSMQFVISGEDDDNKKKVLLRETESSRLYLYDILSGSCHAINENATYGVKSSALLDGVLYCVVGGEESEIIAYDLEHLDSGPKNVFDMWAYTGFDYDYEQLRWECCSARMVSKGNGILAVLCPVNADSEVMRAPKLGCFNFQMVKGRRSNGELYVKAKLLSSSSHLFNGSFENCLTVFVDPSPVADKRERYMLVNGSLKKRSSTACSPAATELAVSIYQLQELLTKSMEESEQKIEQGILQCMKSRLESMESRIISRVQGAPSPRKAEISSSVKASFRACFG